MNPIRLIAALAAALTLSACAAVETPTRNAPLETAAVVGAGLTFDVQAI